MGLTTKAAGLCKRAPVSIKQVQTYLKKVKLYKNVEVEHLTDENIVAEFTRLVKARPKKVIDKMLASKPKPKVKRKRTETIVPRKKPRLELVKSEDVITEPRPRKEVEVKTESISII